MERFKPTPEQQAIIDDAAQFNREGEKAGREAPAHFVEKCSSDVGIDRPTPHRHVRAHKIGLLDTVLEMGLGVLGRLLRH
jgi:hypothetical protein